MKWLRKIASWLSSKRLQRDLQGIETGRIPVVETDNDDVIDLFENHYDWDHCQNVKQEQQ